VTSFIRKNSLEEPDDDDVLNDDYCQNKMG